MSWFWWKRHEPNRDVQEATDQILTAVDRLAVVVDQLQRVIDEERRERGTR